MRIHRGPLSVALASSLLLLLCLVSAAGQTTGRDNPPLIIASVYGRDLYEFYCATCHGRDGKGGGPVAPALKTALPDLTTISVRNGGVFPKARVESSVTSTQDRAMAAHGSTEMPVWGPIFRALDPNGRAHAIRIANIVDYIESLQSRK